METAQDYQDFSRTQVFKDYVKAKYNLEVKSAEFVGFYPEHQMVEYRVWAPNMCQIAFTYEELDAIA